MTTRYPVFGYNPRRVSPRPELTPPLRLGDGYPLEGVAFAPRVDGGTVYCTLEGGVVTAMDAETLERQWTYHPPAFEDAGLFDGEVILVGDRLVTRFGTRLVLLDAGSGDVVSEARVVPFDLRTAFVREQTLVGLSYHEDRWGYVGFDLEELATLWRREDEDAQEFNASSGTDLFFADRAGGLSCIDVETGDLRWREKSRDVLGGARGAGEIHGVPAVLGDLVVVAAEDRWVAAVRREDGESVWSRRVRCEDSIGMCCDSDGTIHVVDEFYTRLDVRTGETITEIDVGDEHRREGVYINTFVTVNGDWLYFGDVTGGTLVAMRAASGRIEWKHECAGGLPLEQAPVVVDGCCYVTDVEGNLYRFAEA